MTSGKPDLKSVEFFDTQFQAQIRATQFELNPFELRAMDHVCGQVLDFGCGLGNLARAAARRGCTVVALDASESAIQHLQRTAQAEGLNIKASLADLRMHAPTGRFDTVVSIGLLMFFDRVTALTQLARLQDAVAAGGTMIVNVLVEGTTFLDMFDPKAYCLFRVGEMETHFAQWDVLHVHYEAFPAPADRIKKFVTLMARKPA